MEITSTHEKRLKSLGKSAEWYRGKFAEQHGACAVCNRSEVRMGLDGRPRPLVASKESDSLFCLRCSARQNKQNQRQRDTNYRNLVKKRASGPQTGDEFWKRNRNALSEADKARYEELDSETILLWDEAKACLEAVKAGREFGEPALRDFVKEVCQSLLDNGTTFVDLVLVDFFSPEYKDTYEQYVQQGRATALFARFGYITAIPTGDAHRFFEFVERHYGLPIALYETYATRIQRIYDFLDHGKVWKQPDQIIKCDTKGCSGTTTIPPMRKRSIPRDGGVTLVTENIPPAQWFCAACTAEHEKQNHAALLRIDERQRQLVQQQHAAIHTSRETIFDDGGVFRE